MSAFWGDFPAEPVQLVLRVTVVYLTILMLLRLAGKRQMAQMGPTEFVMVLLLSNAVQNAMTGPDITLAGGLIAAVTLVLLSRLISYVTYRSARMRAVLEGTPSVLIQNGAVVSAQLAAEMLTEGELIAMLRKQGVESIEEVFLAVLDTEGNLSIARHAPTAKPATSSASPV